jgi:predicted CXXCH cytochrome family protein
MSSNNPRLLVSALAVFGLLLASVAGVSAQNEGVVDTKHNFSGTRDVTFTDLALADFGEVCVYCHTPHGGQVTAPLWNRQFTTSTFTMYNDATGGSSSLDMTFSAQPTGVSLACLSCHDGTIGIDVVINEPNNSVATATGRTLADIYTTGADTIKILGTDLRNDHPISMILDPSADVQFNTLASIRGAGLKLFYDDGLSSSDVVQCATCHNPHSKNDMFLRIDNAGSALCLTCHIK